MSKSDPERTPAKPFGNSYWVRPGQLLAGEYPVGKARTDTAARLQALLDLGITTFIDLTQSGEMPAYGDLLPSASDGVPVRHLRFDIPDHGVPSSPELVTAALNAIDAALAAGTRAYVHCRAGIGRTGTVIGCYLTREGRSGDAALNRLNDLWQDCDRAQQWPSIPETPEQIDYVCQWRESAAQRLALSETPAGLMDRYEGAMFGLAMGDALGKGQPLGTGASDTAMACCVADSLLNIGRVDAEDQMQHYLRWQRGEYFATGQATVPAEVRRAIAAWQWNRKPLAGSHDPSNLDAHPLARTTAVALRFAADPSAALKAAADTARPTLQSPVVLDACRVFAALLVSALNGATKQQLINAQDTAAFVALRQHALKPSVMALLDGKRRRAKANDDIVAVLASAWRHFADTSSFREGMIAIVKDAPSAGATYGALAGAFYGAQATPAEWRDRIARQSILSRLVIGLFLEANKK